MWKVLSNNLNINELEQIKTIEEFYFENNNYSLDELIYFNKNENYSISIIKNENEVVAYSLIYIAEDVIEIYKIATKKEYQNKKLGSILIDNIKGYNKKILIEVSDKDSTINFYLKNGFKQISLRKNYYIDGSNAIIMEYVPIDLNI